MQKLFLIYLLILLLVFSAGCTTDSVGKALDKRVTRNVAVVENGGGGRLYPDLGVSGFDVNGEPDVNELLQVNFFMKNFGSLYYDGLVDLDCYIVGPGYDQGVEVLDVYVSLQPGEEMPAPPLGPQGELCNFTPPQAGDFTVTATIVPHEQDYNPNNNTNSTVITVEAPAPLELWDCGPPPGGWQPQTTYNLMQDVSTDTGPCFEIDADNVTLNCNPSAVSYTIASTAAEGVIISASQVQLLGCSAEGFGNAVLIEIGANNNVVDCLNIGELRGTDPQDSDTVTIFGYNNTVQNCTATAVGHSSAGGKYVINILFGGGGNKIYGNAIIAPRDGILVLGGDDGTEIISNNITAGQQFQNSWGIGVSNSNGVLVLDNDTCNSSFDQNAGVDARQISVQDFQSTSPSSTGNYCMVCGVMDGNSSPVCPFGDGKPCHNACIGDFSIRMEEGQQVGGIAGDNYFLGQLMTIKLESVNAQGPNPPEYMARFRLYDESSNEVDVYTAAQGENLGDQFIGPDGLEAILPDAWVDTVDVDMNSSVGFVDLRVEYG